MLVPFSACRQNFPLLWLLNKLRHKLIDRAFIPDVRRINRRREKEHCGHKMPDLFTWTGISDHGHWFDG